MRILPQGVNPEPVTIYNKMANGEYKRTVIQGYWFTSVSRSLQKRGELPLNAISVYIFDFSKFSMQTEVQKTSEWTIAISDKKKETYLVRGKCNRVIKNEMDLKAFLENEAILKPKVISDNRKGPMSHQHLVVICS